MKNIPKKLKALSNQPIDASPNFASNSFLSSAIVHHHFHHHHS